MQVEVTPEILPQIRLLVDAGMDAAVVVDLNLQVIYNNAAYLHLTGWRKREFNQQKVPGMCHSVFGLESCSGGCLARRVIESGRPMRMDEVKAVHKGLLLHVVAIPLVDAEGRVWGAIEQYRDVTAEGKMQEEYRRLLEQERRRAEQERSQREKVVLELVQATVRSKKERLLAETDGLTGVYNRRYLDARLAEYLTAALAGGPLVALMIFDLDHFKGVNDNYGHAKGDETLRTFAGLLRKAAREHDIVARFGGEEFVILVQVATLQMAQSIATRVWTLVQEYVQEGRLITTTSGGIAVCPGDAEDAAALIQAADRALYAAKHGGRNQICVSNETPKE